MLFERCLSALAVEVAEDFIPRGFLSPPQPGFAAPAHPAPSLPAFSGPRACKSTLGEIMRSVSRPWLGLSLVLVLIVTACYAAPQSAQPSPKRPPTDESGRGTERTSGIFSVLGCGTPSHQAPDDPIVAPGVEGAAHLHQFFGNLSTEADSTYGSLLRSGTDCHYPKDKAAYWFPALVDREGSPEPVQFATAYYHNLPERGPVFAYPPDLRIVAGACLETQTANCVTPGTRNPQLGWHCKDSDQVVPTLIDCPPDTTTGRIKASVGFPQCLKVGTTDSMDHRSHMVYATFQEGCPSGYYRVPRLNVHMTWPVSNARSGGYRLSSDPPGVPPGSTLHADFWNVWDQTELERLVEICFRHQNDVPESKTDPSCKDLRA